MNQETGHLHLAHIVEGRQPAQWTQCSENLSCEAICSSHVMHSWAGILNTRLRVQTWRHAACWHDSEVAFQSNSVHGHNIQQSCG